MSSADRPGAIFVFGNWMRTWPRRYGFAFAAVCIAIAAQRTLEITIGFPHSFLLFYPTILMVSLLTGFSPGAIATVIFGTAAEYFYARPGSPNSASDETQKFGLILFVLVGITISWLADSLRRRANRLQEFERAVEGLDEMILVVDREYRYLIANRAFVKYLGKKRKDLIGHTVAEIIGTEQFVMTVKSKLDESFGGEVVHYEMAYLHPLGGNRELRVAYFPIGGSKGVDRVACVLQDVTDCKEANRALRLFRALIDHSNDAVEVIDPDTLRFVDVNMKACEDLGYTREELLGLTVLDIDPQGGEICAPEALHALRTKGSIVRESTHKRRDGSIFPVEISVRYVQLERSYFVTVVRDISDRKQSERALREIEDRYSDLVEHSEDLVCTHDLTGKLLSVNPAASRLLGYGVDELLRIPMRQLIAPEFRTEFDQYLGRIAQVVPMPVLSA